MKSKAHGVIVVPYVAPRLDWPECTEFWLMRYLRGPVEVNGKWAFPGGGVESGETVEHCAYREFEEETGLLLPPGRLLPFGPRSAHERPDGSIFFMDYFLLRMDVRETLACTEPTKHTPWRRFGVLELPHPIAPSGEIAIGRFLTRANR